MPLFSQPTTAAPENPIFTKQPSSSDEESTSDADSSGRSRSSSALSATSINTAVKPGTTKPEVAPVPELSTSNTEASKSREPADNGVPSCPAPELSQPRSSLYQINPLNGKKRKRGNPGRIAKEQVRKRGPISNVRMNVHAGEEWKRFMLFGLGDWKCWLESGDC